MKWLSKLFRRQSRCNQDNPPATEKIKAVYSEDGEQRYTLSRNDKGYYTYHFEKLTVENIKIEGTSYLTEPFWEEMLGSKGLSIYASEAEAMKGLMSEPIYKQYFEKEST